MRIEPGTRAIVTGASAGIGRALAAELAARGAVVGLLARGRERLEQLAAELPGEPVVLAADIARRSEVERAVERFTRLAGGLDLFAANAGIAHYGPFADVPIERAEEMIRINVLGTTYAVHAALRPMLDAAAGHLVITSSGAGIRAFPWAAVYGGTKAYDRGFAEALRHELSGTGVSLTTVFPGEVESELHEHEREAMPDWRAGDAELDPGVVARMVLAAVESDTRNVYAPRAVRALGLNGLAPRLTDRLLARVRGRSAAPRPD